jgi:hypothetical protein
MALEGFDAEESDSDARDGGSPEFSPPDLRVWWSFHCLL